MIPTCTGTKFASRTRLAFPGISQSSLVTVGALWARVLIGSFCSRQAVISCWTFYWFDHATWEVFLEITSVAFWGTEPTKKTPSLASTHALPLFCQRLRNFLCNSDILRLHRKQKTNYLKGNNWRAKMQPVTNILSIPADRPTRTDFLRYMGCGTENDTVKGKAIQKRKQENQPCVSKDTTHRSD